MISSTLLLEATVTGLVDILEILPGCGLTSLSMTMTTATARVRDNVCIKAEATMEMDGPLQDAPVVTVFTTLAS